MVVVYKEMSKLHHIVASMMAIQAHTKERVSMLKEAMTTLDRIHEWSSSTQENRWSYLRRIG